MIEIQGASTGNVIGGTAAGAGNLIAFNFLKGVKVVNGSGHQILRNSIHSNGGLGIYLNSDGVTVNDAGDIDTGANALQNFPVLTQVHTDGTGLVWVDGTMNSTANTTYRIELFVSGTGDASGFREGETFLVGTNVTTDAGGNDTFRETIGTAVAAGSFISATATNLTTNNTSEFSQSLVAISGSLTVTNTNDTIDGDTSSDELIRRLAGVSCTEDHRRQISARIDSLLTSGPSATIQGSSQPLREGLRR